MSHDARTPLSSMNVSAALLADCALCDAAKAHLAAVRGGARVLLSIVQHVMLLKRLDAGTPAGALAPVAHAPRPPAGQHAAGGPRCCAGPAELPPAVLLWRWPQQMPSCEG